MQPETGFVARSDERPLTRFERRGHRLGHGVAGLELHARGLTITIKSHSASLEKSSRCANTRGTTAAVRVNSTAEVDALQKKSHLRSNAAQD